MLMVERRSQVGVPEQCAGYVAQAIRRHLDLPHECVAQAVDRLRTWLPDGSCQVTEMSGYVLQREALDQHLAVRAVQAGARLLVRTAASNVVPGRDQEARPTAACNVSVVLRQEARDVLADAKVVIGADGPRSAVARSLGLEPGPLVRAIQYEVVVPRRLEEAEVFFRPVFRGGYAWLFPAGETARVGAAFSCDAAAGLDGLRRLIAELEQQGRIGGSAISFTSGLVPAGGPSACRQGNILLAGDAAGHTHPVTGAGILNAIIAGEMAGRAAARAALSGNPAALNDYEADLDLVLAPSLQRARKNRSRLDDAWDASPAGLSNTIRESWIAYEEYNSR